MRRWMTSLPARADLALALVLFAVVTVLVVPLSPRVLDVLIVISFVMALVLVLIATRVSSALELLTFPALLLVSTLYRLAINVASTKLVLVEGQAGAVIESVGKVVVGGNLLAGVCVFLIVALVQFMVVAKGAERVAEVAARFSLDAMPGKQMSIDADLRSGSMTPDEARRRRDALDVESRLFGSMDGAMKFVKGDAIAGLVIAFVNVFGGLASGVLYKGMSLGEAMHRYTVLSIGDALVSQVPSLLVAIAAGLVITRVSSPENDARSLASHIVGDLRRHPIVLAQVGAACIALSAVPVMPTLVLLPIGAVLVATAFWIRSTARRESDRPVARADTPMPAFARTGDKTDPPLFSGDDVSFEDGLVIVLDTALADALDAARIGEAVTSARSRLRAAGHSAFPGLRIARSGVDGRGVEIRLQGIRWCRFDWPEQGASPRGFHPMRPVRDGLAGYEALAGGGRSADLEAVLGDLVEAACRQCPHRLLSLEMVHDLMLAVRRDRPKLVEEIAPNIPLPRLTELIAALMAEGLTVRHVPAILDALLPMLPMEGTVDEILERLLVRLAPLRCADLAGAPLAVVALDEGACTALVPSLAGQRGEDERFSELRRQLVDLSERARPDQRLDLLCRPGVRAVLSALVREIDPRFRVFGFDGVPASVVVETVRTIQVDQAGWGQGGPSVGIVADPAVPALDPSPDVMPVVDLGDHRARRSGPSVMRQRFA